MRFQAFDTPVGPMIAVGDGERLYAVEFSDEAGRERQLARLRDHVRADVTPGATSTTTRIVEKLERYFRGEPVEFAVPLHRGGSPFQNAVWDALTRIPAGEVRSYADVTRELGDMSAIRAVAQAAGANPFAIVIPCHRMINSGGKLGGYGGGLARKRWLLEHEQRMIGSADSFELR